MIPSAEKHRSGIQGSERRSSRVSLSITRGRAGALLHEHSFSASAFSLSWDRARDGGQQAALGKESYSAEGFLSKGLQVFTLFCPEESMAVAVFSSKAETATKPAPWPSADVQLCPSALEAPPRQT